MSDDERRRRDPRDLTPREAIDRYLRRRRSDATESSIYAWRYRLKLFAEWCESVNLDRVGELRGYDLDEFYELRSAEVAPATLEGEMWTLKKFIEFLEQIEAVDDGLADRVRIPDVDEEDRTDETQLATEDALPLLHYYRTDSSAYGTRAHAYLELAWLTGARQGGLRALDLRDVYLEENFVEFRHRPETGTPLKNKRSGERPVAIPAETADVLERFIEHHRLDRRDDHGRAPLLVGNRGRPDPNTVRVWSYLATEPCLYGPCPHGKERETCEWTEYGHASKCPSSRSPHQIRTGSITWQLNLGIPPEVVAERVNATVRVIRDHYDKASTEDRLERHRTRMERDRRPFIEQIDLDFNHDHDNQ